MLCQGEPAAAGDDGAHPPAVVGAKLEARGVDDAVKLNSPPLATMPFSVMRLIPLPAVSMSVTLGRLKLSRYSLWMQGRFTSGYTTV